MGASLYFCHQLANCTNMSTARAFKIILYFLLINIFIPNTIYAGSHESEFKRAELMLVHDKNAEATDILLKLLNNFELVDPVEIVKTHALLGTAYYKMGNIDKASEHFTDMLNFDPSSNLDKLTAPAGAIALFKSIKKSLAKEKTYKEKLSIESNKKTLPTKKLKIKSSTKKPKKKKIYRTRKSYSAYVAVTKKQRKNNKKFKAIYHFLPFGTGQFMQKRNERGYLYMSIESAAVTLAITSLVLYEKEKNADGTFDHPGRANTYRDLFYIGLFTFIGTAAIGTIDSIYLYNNKEGESLALKAGTDGIKFDFMF